MRRNIGHGAIVCSAMNYREPGTDSEFTWVETADAKAMFNLAVFKALEAESPMPTFGYLFEGAGLAIDPDAFVKLGRVGAAMVSDRGIIGPKGLPAILTYFGQFVDHDITLNTDTDPESVPEFSVSNQGGSLTRNARERVLEVIQNGRIASLRLDSVYGDNDAIEPLLRDGAKMKIGKTTAGRPNDLPRLIDLPDGHDINDKPTAALIGDGRNDENLVIAQLHLAFLRFHNAIADMLDSGMSEHEQFLEAKRITILVYQWLVLHEYCEKVCDAEVFGEAMTVPFAGAYTAFSQGRRLMPLEFSVAAFRFGHSMIRPEYHFNDNFGPNGNIARAPLSELFRFTGGAGLGGTDRLSDLWVIDWNNFLRSDDDERAARGIDSRLAEGLDELVVDGADQFPADVREALKHLPKRNLRRSYVLAIPTAQEILASFADPDAMEPLTQEEMLGFAGGIVGTEGFSDQTPLWLYLLLEAELRGDGKRLGKLGSFIIAQTLVGLLAEDAGSILHVGPNAATPWHPEQEPIDGKVIDSFASLLAFAEVN